MVIVVVIVAVSSGSQYNSSGRSHSSSKKKKKVVTVGQAVRVAFIQLYTHPTPPPPSPPPKKKQRKKPNNNKSEKKNGSQSAKVTRQNRLNAWESLTVSARHRGSSFPTSARAAARGKETPPARAGLARLLTNQRAARRSLDQSNAETDSPSLFRIVLNKAAERTGRLVHTNSPPPPSLPFTHTPAALPPSPFHCSTFYCLGGWKGKGGGGGEEGGPGSSALWFLPPPPTSPSHLWSSLGR